MESVGVRGCCDKLGKAAAAPNAFAAKKVKAPIMGKINKWQYFSRAGEIGSLIARFSICPVRACQSDARSHGSPWIKASEAWREGRWRLVSGGGAGALCLSGRRVGGRGVGTPR